MTYAGSLAKGGSVAIRGIYWDPSIDVTSIETAQGLVFPVQLHNSFLLEDPCLRRLLSMGVGAPAGEARRATATIFTQGQYRAC